jgi:hypothetical protein
VCVFVACSVWMSNSACSDPAEVSKSIQTLGREADLPEEVITNDSGG